MKNKIDRYKMKVNRGVLVVATVVVLVAMLALLDAASVQGLAEAGQNHGDLGRLQKALDKDGFDVTAGEAVVFNPANDWCKNNTDIEPMYANTEPYFVLRVPKSATDPEPVIKFQMRADEAIVIVGLTPPPEKYFGFYPFLATKVYPDGERKPSMINLVDAVNNATIQTLGSTPFNSPVALIFTPDKGTDARIRAALLRAGYPEAIINTVVFPASMLNLGYGETADEFWIHMRNLVWQNQADGDAYIANPPLQVFRVTPRTPADPDPFPMPRLRVKGTGQTEMGLLNKLTELRASIIAANSGLYATDLLSKPAIGAEYDSYDNLQREINVLGDARDGFFLNAGYIPEFGTSDEVKLADDEFLMVYGANHVATGKTAYMSINFYSSNVGRLSIGTVLDDKLPGTATPYLPDGDPAADLMYAYKVSRNCESEPNCLQLSIEDCSRLTIDANTVLGIIFRMYLEPTTGVGAANGEVLFDRVLKFSPRVPQP